ATGQRPRRKDGGVIILESGGHDQISPPNLRRSPGQRVAAGTGMLAVAQQALRHAHTAHATFGKREPQVPILTPRAGQKWIETPDSIKGLPSNQGTAVDVIPLSEGFDVELLDGISASGGAEIA